MTVLQSLAFTMLLDVFTVLTFLLFRVTKKGNIRNISCLLIVSICATLFVSINTINGYRHGMYDFNIAFKDMLSHTKLSPVEDGLPSTADLPGSIIIYYKFGCADCEGVYTELKASIHDKENIYWVSSRSKQGKQLRELYPIEAVPSGIYISTSSTASAPLFIKKVLYERDSKEQIHLNSTNLKRLLELQQNGR